MSVKILNHSVGPIGYGLMGLTWRATPPPTEQAFAAMNAALAGGSNMWNGGEIYGPPERNSLHLLQEYFTQYPDHASKILLSIKGGINAATHAPDGTREGVRRSIDNCNKILAGTKKIDIFQCARVDPNTPIETTIAALAECVKEGMIGGIGLSEVRAETIRRAAAIHPIAAVEVEMSLWSTEILSNGVAATCAELHIPIVAYSPLSQGALTGDWGHSNAELPDHVKAFPRFQDGVLQANMRLTDDVASIAAQKGVTRPQVAIGWVRSMSGRTLKDGTTLGVIVPIPGATTEARVKENMADVTLSEGEMVEIEQILERNTVVGARYGGPVAKLSDG